MCAIEAGTRGRRVAVLDHADRLGKKILISGGGRCNFTNLHTQPENFLSSNPHFAKSALSRYTPTDFIALVEKHRIPYHEKTLGQLFCDRSAPRHSRHARRRMPRRARHDFPECKNPRSNPHRQNSSCTQPTTEFRAPTLVVATGGLSIPKIGATSFGYDLARQFGLKIRDPWPGLVPLVLERRRSLPLLRSHRSFRRSGRLLRRPALPRKNADHASRPERSSDPADFFLLEEAAADHASISLRNSESDCHLPRSQSPPNRDNTPRRIPKSITDAPGRPLARTTTRQPRGRTPRSTISSSKLTRGPSSPPEPKATKKPKSPPEASTPTNSLPKQWSAARFPASSSSAKLST